MNSHSMVQSHGSLKESGRSALVKKQNKLDAVQEQIRMWNHLKEEFASVWATSAKEAMKRGNTP